MFPVALVADAVHATDSRKGEAICRDLQEQGVKIIHTDDIVRAQGGAEK